MPNRSKRSAPFARIAEGESSLLLEKEVPIVDESESEISEDLIRKAQAGDGAAKDRLFAKMKGVIERLVARLTRDPNGRDETVQRSWIAADKGLPTYDPGRPFLAWLRSIVARSFKNYLRDEIYRRQDRGSGRTTVLRLLNDVAGKKLTQGLSKCAKEEMIDDMLRLIEDLPAQQKKIFCRVRDGKTVPEIAAELKMKHAAVRQSIVRSYKTLRERMRKKYGDTAPR